MVLPVMYRDIPDPLNLSLAYIVYNKEQEGKSGHKNVYHRFSK